MMQLIDFPRGCVLFKSNKSQIIRQKKNPKIVAYCKKKKNRWKSIENNTNVWDSASHFYSKQYRALI